MDNFLNRVTLFSLVTALWVTPLYLALKTGTYGLLFLYVPVVAFTIAGVFAVVEASRKQEEEVENVAPIR